MAHIICSALHRHQGHGLRYCLPGRLHSSDQGRDREVRGGGDALHRPGHVQSIAGCAWMSAR